MIAFVDGKLRQIYTLGERVWTYCPTCMDREWHVWDGHELKCTNHTDVEDKPHDPA